MGLINGFLVGKKTNPGDTTTLPYKTYGAFITTDNAGEPTARILQNNLGTIVWTHIAEGIFQATCADPVFTIGKRIIKFGPPPTEQPAWTFLEYTAGGNSTYYIQIECVDALGYNTNVLIDQYIEINVYN